MMNLQHKHGIVAAAAALGLAACGGHHHDDPAPAPSPAPPVQQLPQLSPAIGAAIGSCDGLAARLAYPDTAISAVNAIAAGTLSVAGKPVGAHCQVLGQMMRRVSPQDGKTYAIGFEMRLPLNWNGRFFYQANGGTDGSVATAVGPVGGGGPLDNALNRGFAVISSDAGHSGQGPAFGIDFQARLDYGYQAVGKLTPMAKSLIQAAYGKGPDRSYIGGCSNGGRHAMVAAARYADQYDGFLAGDPGFRLPLAAIANIAGGKTYASLATDKADIGTGFTQIERALVANAVLGKCDAQDGAADGLVQDTGACQKAFDIQRDVPTCSGARDGTCLSAAQKSGIAALFAGATTEAGTKIYTSFPWDAGLATTGWSSWKFGAAFDRDAGAVGQIWSVPPEDPAGFNGQAFALNGSLATMLARVGATSSVYTEPALSFMLPPEPANLGKLKSRGAKMLVYHGTSDPIFSSDDTTGWYEALRSANGGDAANFARFFRIPGMNHCSGGPATDQFDALTPLVDWVEKGQAPDALAATARGAGNAGGVNGDVPRTWSAARTRPLCAYPKVARYTGSGDVEQAASFTCK
ncbi:MAG TPA: tannase/feruloyl esterase family alpha/beta hydrolase [Telluria sp.]|jgi:feruloyl esterase